MKIRKNIIVCSEPNEKFGYYGWPSIARLDDGTLLVAASGKRFTHVCPWGRTVICKSTDNGATWTAPVVVNNTPIDDRDAGIIALGGPRAALTWFTSNTLVLRGKNKNPETGEWDDGFKEMGVVMDQWDGDTCEKYIGSWIRISPDGEYWGIPRQAPVNTPHGFIVLKDGSWLYLGKRWVCTHNGLHSMHSGSTTITAARSTDEGKTWELLGNVPGTDDPDLGAYCHEPHVIELKDGSLLGAVRLQKNCFKTMLTRSSDGGRTWSLMEEAGMDGAPAHFLRHSSGAIVCVYGYRLEPYGQRAKISLDEGKTWSDEIVIRDDGPCGDLGYPASVELPDGAILTIYYQQLQAGQKCSLLGTIWEI